MQLVIWVDGKKTNWGNWYIVMNYATDYVPFSHFHNVGKYPIYKETTTYTFQNLHSTHAM